MGGSIATLNSASISLPMSQLQAACVSDIAFGYDGFSLALILPTIGAGSKDLEATDVEDADPTGSQLSFAR